MIPKKKNVKFFWILLNSHWTWSTRWIKLIRAWEKASDKIFLSLWGGKKMKLSMMMIKLFYHYNSWIRLLTNLRIRVNKGHRQHMILACDWICSSENRELCLSRWLVPYATAIAQFEIRVSRISFSSVV